MRTPADSGWGDPFKLSWSDMVPVEISPGVTIRVRNHDLGVIFTELVRRLKAAGWDGPYGGIVDDWGYAGRLKRWAQAAGQTWGKAPMSSVSEHAWGTAIDLDTIKNPMLGGRPYNMWEHTTMPRETPAICAELDVEWGGLWDVPWDPQHFQYRKGPAEARDLAEIIRDYWADEPEDEVTEEQMARLEKAMLRAVLVGLNGAPNSVYGEADVKGWEGLSLRGRLAQTNAKLDEVLTKLDRMSGNAPK